MLPPPLPTEVRVQGAALVVPKNYDFPDVCLFTGRTDDLVRVREKRSWHNPWIYLTALTGLLIYVILAVTMRKSTDVSYCISRKERTRRRKWHFANWGIFLLVFVSLIVAGAGDISLGFYLAPVFLVASLVIYFLRVRWLYPSRIDDREAAIRGIAPEVMQRLSGVTRPT